MGVMVAEALATGNAKPPRRATGRLLKQEVRRTDPERVMGFEPTTHGLGSRSSTAELHPRVTLIIAS